MRKSSKNAFAEVSSALQAWLTGLWGIPLALVLLIGMPSSVLAEHPPSSLVVASAYWEDTSTQASLAQAQKQSYTPFEGMFNRGYSNSVHWIKLHLAASEAPIGLRLSPPWLDQVTIFDPALPDQPLRAGDRHPEGINTKSMLGYTMVLPASAQPRTLWIRLQSTSIHRLSIDAMAQKDVPQAESRVLAWTSVHAATLTLLLLALVCIWGLQPEQVLGIYLVRHLIFMVYSLGFLGLPDLLWPEELSPPGFFDTAFSVSVVLTLPAGLWFDITLLSSYRPRPLLVKLLKILAWGSLILPLLVLIGEVRIALESTVLGLMLASLLVFLAAAGSRPEASVERLMSKKVMLAYYALILSSLLIGLSTVVGFKQPQGWSQYQLIVHGLLSSLVMTVILFVRGQRRFRKHARMSWQLQKNQQDMELEQRRRQEQSQFLHMLMHELKTPLTVVSLALGTRNRHEENLAHASRAVQDMKAIIDRCVEADRMGDVSLQRHKETVDLEAMIREISRNIPELAKRLQLHVQPPIPALQSDRQLLQIVLTNLLDNASRYSDPFTPVIVNMKAAPQGNRAGVSFKVANTPGLAGWPDATQLFSKYYRASGAQRDSGSGLGLYLSRQLAQSLGGSLTYQPDAKRVEFELWIPLNFD